MTACGIKGCRGELLPTQPGLGFVRPFRCSECGRLEHSAVCVDEGGKRECVCGLDDDPEAMSGEVPW